jgi:hypothetical protein
VKRTKANRVSLNKKTKKIFKQCDESMISAYKSQKAKTKPIKNKNLGGKIMSIENLPIKEQTDSESVAEKPEKTPENKPRKKRFKPDKKHVQGFIAGMLVMAILVTGVAAGIYPASLREPLRVR